MPACRTSGVYTMHTNGANQTPSNSQFWSACATSSPMNNHPRASTTYAVNLPNRTISKDDGVENDRGRPTATASVAASEKLSTDVMETTVDARQRLNVLRIKWSGALDDDVPAAQTNDVAPAARLTTTNSTHDPIWATPLG